MSVGVTRGPFYKHGLTLIPPWISNHMLKSKVKLQWLHQWSLGMDNWFHHIPASIATLAQRRHWSASSRSAADVAPTLVFRRLRCYGMSAFCRSATVGISWFADVLCLDIGGWKSSVSRINVVVQPDYRYIKYIFRHHDQKNYYASNLNKMYHFAASILFYDIAQLRFPPKAIWVQQVVSTVFPGAWLRKIRQCFFVFRQLSRRFF